MATAAPEEVDTVWKAAAYGDFDALKRLADAATPELLHQPDEQGYYAVQWASLNNRVAVLNYLIDRGCDLNAADRTGQTAVHWAAVRGSLPALETLLRAGASLAAADSRGYTTCHVAAQYAQTATLYRLALKWNADIDSPDGDGRTPLHWAAYKGAADSVRLLLVLGARAALPDREGCTPLHWAAIRGNSEAVTALLQGGATEALDMPDGTGAVPSQLAIEKGHRLLGLHLAEHRMREDAEARQRRGPLASLAGLHLSPIVWGIVVAMLLLLAYGVVQNSALPPAGQEAVAGTWLTLALASAGLYYLYRTTTADPGFLPRNTAGGGGGSQRSEPRLRSSNGKQYQELGPAPGAAPGHWGAIDSPALWAGNWGQLCVTCKIVRPLRSKHCSVTKRCVQCYDHYCPWVGNCIGRGNRHLFLAFLWLEFGAVAVSLAVGSLRIHSAVSVAGGAVRGVALAPPIAFVVCDMFLLLSLAALALAQASQVARNVTTNELANWHRYKYLHAADGDFHNPFDQGCRRNCREVCYPDSAAGAVYLLHSQEGEGSHLIKMEQGVG